MDESPLTSGTLDGILSKYVSVWLWSILFGVTSGVSVSFVNYRTDRAWGILGFLLLALLLIGVVFLMLAWVALLGYLRDVLIPRFILHREPDDPRFAAVALRRSVTALLLATLLRLLVMVVELAYSSASFVAG